MPKKRYTAEEIIHKLREAEVWLSQGKSIDRPALTGPGLGLVYAASEPDPLVGPVWCASSQARKHGSGCSPWIRAANAEGGISPKEECGLTSL